MDVNVGEESKSKSNRIYKFCPYKIFKIEPTGNCSNGTPCPKARSGHRIVANESNIYSFGGYNPLIESNEDVFQDYDDWHQPCPLFKELWEFNIAARTWTKLETSGTTPEKLASHAAVLLYPYLLIYGGTGVPFGMSSSNSFHICNLDNLSWKHIETSGEPPLEQYGQAVTVYKGGLYVVGGTTGFEYSMSVHRLDLKTCEWEELGSVFAQSEPRYRHEIAIKDDILYVFGGGTATESFGFKEVPSFSLKECSWNSLPTSDEYPEARRCHGCVKLENNVYICGGYDGEAIFPDIWKFDLAKFMWEKLPYSLPRPVYFHSTALTSKGQMFIFGGVTNIDLNTRSNELYSVWLTIPLLQEICWEAIVHYIPHIPQLSAKKLLELGLPSRFLNRINFNKDHKEDPPHLLV